MNEPPLWQHWEATHRDRGDDVSWFEARPETSLELIGLAALTQDDPVIDIGGGASALVDALVSAGHRDVTVLDLSASALQRAEARVGTDAGVHWIVDDVRSWQPTREYTLWHDRAAFHFLTEPSDRTAYLQRLDRAVPHGWIVLATFAPDGPDACSGLAVQRWSEHDLGELLTGSLAGATVVRTTRHVHVTPWGSEQPFSYVLVRRD